MGAENEFRESTAKLFGMVGGVALLTLVINGPTAGPLLRRLGLVTPTDTRKKVIENYRQVSHCARRLQVWSKLRVPWRVLCREYSPRRPPQHMAQNSLLDYVWLLADKRFQDVDFTVVKDHVPFLSE